MEIWHDTNHNDTKVGNNTLSGFSETLTRLRQQRKAFAAIDRLMDDCQTLKENIDRKNRQLIVGI